MKQIGLIAGSGQFPLIWVREAKRQGYEVTAVGHVGETEEELETLVDSLVWVRLGELNKIIKAFKKAGITETALAGGIRKTRMFKDIKPDLRALSLLARVGAPKDDALLRAISDELATEGIKVVESTVFLSSLLTPQGLLTSRVTSREEEKDVACGWKVVKELGQLDIGQCVVVKSQTVLAVEAIEGTDETIRRGGRLAQKGAVVVKACKPQQDVRFDLPTVGKQTIAVMLEVGATALALEAGRTIMLEKELLIKKADESGISVIGVKR